MEQLVEQLTSLGLGDYEARVYTVLIQYSPAPATLIAKKCNLSRSSVYTTLGSLITKGLVATTHNNQVKQFIAQDYASLEQLLTREQKQLQEKFACLDSLKTDLQLLTKTVGTLPQVTFFEGQEGLKKIYLAMLREADTDACMYILRDEFIWSPSWRFVFEEAWHAKMKRIKQEKNVTTKLLVNDSSLERSHTKVYKTRQALEYKFIPKKRAITNFALYILGNTVSIMSVEEHNLMGIKISNHVFASNFRNIFELLWVASKK